MSVRPTNQAGGFTHGGDAPERNETSDSQKKEYADRTCGNSIYNRSSPINFTDPELFMPSGANHMSDPNRAVDSHVTPTSYLRLCTHNTNTKKDDKNAFYTDSCSRWMGRIEILCLLCRFYDRIISVSKYLLCGFQNE